MYRAILVPLDGSELAEIVLPHVEALVKATGGEAEVILLHVCQPSWHEAVGQEAAMAREVEEAKRKQAEEYLAAMETQLKEKGLKVRSELLFGCPAGQILDYTARHPVDLIAMASHGRSGISRWAYGSVTSKVLQGIATPTLVVTPKTK